MKVLYVSARINAPDGSSVHGRAFYKSVGRLGHEIRTYPEITDIEYITEAPKATVKKDLAYYIRRIDLELVKVYLKRIHWRVEEWLDFMDGFIASRRDLKALQAIVDEFKPDVVVYRHTVFNFAPLWLCKRNNLPGILEVNSTKTMEAPVSDGNRQASALVRHAENYVINRSDCAFAVSEPIKAFMAETSQQKHLSVIPNGVDVDVFNAVHYVEQRDALRSKLAIEDKFVLGYVGSYKGWHGVDISLNVLEELIKTDTNFHLLLIGNGAEYAAIKQRVMEKQLQDHVTQIDYVPHDQVAAHVSAFDCALMTYPAFEGFYFSPLKIFEYMAMSKVVVSTAIGQISDLLVHRETGLMIEDPEVAQFCALLRELKEDDAFRHQIEEKARQYVVDHYSWDANAERVLACLDFKKDN